MPVSQSDTATTVASTGTYDVARFGIEGRSVRDGARSCQPPGVRRDGERRLISPAPGTTLPGSMPSTVANADPVGTPIISFAIFAAYKRS